MTPPAPHPNQTEWGVTPLLFHIDQGVYPPIAYGKFCNQLISANPPMNHAPSETPREAPGFCVEEPVPYSSLRRGAGGVPPHPFFLSRGYAPPP